jgi:hypothetical protein
MIDNSDELVELLIQDEPRRCVGGGESIRA